MAELNTTKINGNISATGTVSGTNITTMQNEINELNDNLEHCSVISVYNDENCSLLGITDSTTLNELVDDGIVPIDSKCILWINGNTIYGQEIRSALYSLYNKDIYGYLTITRYGPERHLAIKAYDTLDTYETTYTEINGAGWYETWLQTAGKPRETTLSNGWYAVHDGVKCTFYFNGYTISSSSGLQIDTKFNPKNELCFSCYVEGGSPCIGIFTVESVIRFYSTDFASYIADGTKVHATVSFDLA